MEQNTSIEVIYDDAERTDLPGEKGFFSARISQIKRVGELDVDHFSEVLKRFCATMGTALRGVTTSIEDFELKHFEITAAVTAKGEIRLIGAVGTEVSGGIKLTFDRK